MSVRRNVTLSMCRVVSVAATASAASVMKPRGSNDLVSGTQPPPPPLREGPSAYLRLTLSSGVRPKPPICTPKAEPASRATVSGGSTLPLGATTKTLFWPCTTNGCGRVTHTPSTDMMQKAGPRGGGGEDNSHARSKSSKIDRG